MPTVWGSTMERTVDWEDDRPRTQGWMFNKDVSEVVRHFRYHPQKSMNQTVKDKDKEIVAAWVVRKMRAGFTVQQLKRAVDKFYQSYAKEYDAPAYALVSNDMQDRIFDGLKLTYEDPVLDWITSGMPDDGPFQDPRGMRSLLLLRCHEGLLRYPDVVVQLLGHHGTLRSIDGLLRALEYIIQWNLGNYDDKDELRLSQLILKNYDLPTELKSGHRGNLREAATSTDRSLEKMMSAKRKQDGN